MLQVMQAVLQAEARGDAAGALELISARPCDTEGRIFWNPHRISRLAQITQLGTLLPGWATSRWIVEQSLIQMDPTLRPAHEEAMRIAIELRGGPAALSGVDALDAQVKVMDHDWVFKQLVVYEYGGLARFLHAWASPDLVAGADDIDAWVTAPVRALRLESREPSVLRWTDLTTDQELVVPNLGAAVLELPGEHALARVVPTAEGPMFDGVPLGVTEGSARRAANDPASWLDALWPDAGTDDHFADLVHGNQLLTDVPDRLRLLALGDRLPRSSELTEDSMASAAIALAREMVAGRPAAHESWDLWPCLAAELVAPDVFPRLERCVGPSDRPCLDALRDVMPSPAAEICGVLADALDAAA